MQVFITAWHVDHKKPRHHQPLNDKATHRHTNLNHHGQAVDAVNAANRARQANSNNNNQRVPETKEEARQRKYRYLYQVRTAHGDIISKVSEEFTPIIVSRNLLLSASLPFQNYVSALQRNIQPCSPGPSTSTKTGSHERDTFRSDRTRMTNLMDTNSAERDRTTIYFDHWIAS